MPTAKLIKPTTKNSSPMRTGHARDNKPAEAYAAPHTMSGGPAKQAKVVDPNTLAGKSVNPSTPSMRVSAGDPGADNVKTSGIKMRGAGAATKGVMSRGPMG